MNWKERAAILRGAIKQREETHEREVTFCDAAGKEIGQGKVEPMEDGLYQALKFAPKCVENPQG